MAERWTEKTITTVQRTFIKGTFSGKYHAERREDGGPHYRELYDMHIYQAEIVLDEVRTEVAGPFPEATGLMPFKGTFARPAKCFDPKSGTYFQLNIEDPCIANPQLSKITKEGSEHLGTISGTIYGNLIKLITEKVPVAQPAPSPLPPINDWAGWTRTATHEFDEVGGIQYRRDYYRHTHGDYRWGNWYAAGRAAGYIDRRNIFSGIGFGLLFVFLLIKLSWVGLILLGFLLLAGLFARIRRTSFGTAVFSLFYGLLTLFYLAGIVASIFRSSAGAVHGTATTPVTANLVKTEPIRRHGQQPSDSPAADEWIIHHRAWTDLQGNQYEGDVKVLKSAFQRAMLDYAALEPVNGLGDVYRAMALADAPRLKGVFPLFDSLKTARGLDSLQFAVMLVSFVQDIPYSTVTDGACQEADHQLSQSYAPATGDCIGQIPYGVQSPVEFMANFHGDCDTRTLFLFTLFNHYHYQAAILGSTVFRHSLLGVNLPAGGSCKLAGTARYVLWETTGKGFAPGQLRPEIDHMEYWNFYLTNTPKS